MEVIASFIYSDLIKQDNYYLITNKSIRVKGIDANNSQDAIEYFKKWIKQNKKQN